MTPPVIFLVYRRPELTARALAAIREVRPQRLYVVADGPRSETERFQTDATRRTIQEGVDWRCDLRWNAADHNLGLAKRVSSGITWAFDTCDEAIILEDDCVARPEFFQFCGDLLARHRNRDEVMAITGDNFQNGNWRGWASYYFSMYPHCWGWATWKRAWNHYDANLEVWPQTTAFLETLSLPALTRYWEGIKRKVDAGQVDSWAYRWMFSIWARQGLTATPNRNLVTNIGFGEDATHTTSAASHLADITSLRFPLRHPFRIRRNSRADLFVNRHVFGIAS